MSGRSNVRVLSFEEDSRDDVVELLAEETGLDIGTVSESLAGDGVVAEALDGDEATHLAEALRGLGATVEVVPTGFVVRGSISQEDYRLRGVDIHAVDTRPAEERRLGEATTGRGGAYEIRYEYPSDADEIDLVIRAVDGMDRTLAVSDVITGPELRTTLELAATPLVGDEGARFVMIRPPEKPSEGLQPGLGFSVVEFVPIDSSVGGAGDGEGGDGRSLRDRLVAMREEGAGRVDLVRRAAEFVRSDAFVADLGQLDVPIARFAEALTTETTPNRAALTDLVETVFDRPATDVVASEEYSAARRRVSESLLAVTVAGLRGTERYKRLLHGVRLFDLIELVAANEPLLDDESAIEDVLDSLVVLKDDRLFPLPEFPEAVPSRNEADGAREEEETRLRERFDRIVAAREEVERVGFIGRRIPEELEQEGDSEDADIPERSTRDSDTADEDETEAVVAESTALAVIMPRLTTVREDLSEETLRTLDELDVRMDERVNRAVTELERAEAEAGGDLFARRLDVTSPVISIGDGHHTATAGFGEFDLSQELTDEVANAGVVLLGWGEHDVVRYGLPRYLMSDVLHIETALEGEGKTRTHRRAKTTEETFLREEETVEEEERDLRTTNAFELQSTSQQVIEERSSQEFDVGVSAGYPPYVQIDVGYGQSKENSESKSMQTASRIAREATSEATTRMKRQLREVTTRRILTEVEETNVHEIDNTDGDEHIVGVYRGVVRESEARVFNTGRAMLLQFFVPQPAALYLKSVTDAPPEGTTIPKPVPPHYSDTPLRPEHISINNYQAYAAAFELSGMPLPPPKYEYRVVGTSREAGSLPQEDAEGHHEEHPPEPTYFETLPDMDVPAEGYVLEDGVISFAPLGAGSHTSAVTVTSPYFSLRYDNPSHDRSALFSEIDENQPLDYGNYPLKIQVKSRFPEGFNVAVGARYYRTKEALAGWQQEVYDLIMNAYRSRKSEYEDQLRAASVAQGIQISGHDRQESLRIIEQELKRGAITLLRKKAFNEDAIEEILGIPDISFADLAEFEQEVQFFEQMCEWHHMAYVFRPYYWTAREEWTKLMNLTDADPLFTNFLGAGGAHVIVPIREGWNEDVLAFLDSGTVFAGGPVESVSDPRFVDIAQELREQQGGLELGEPSESWIVREPTDLVTLQPGPELPDLAEEAAAIDSEGLVIEEEEDA